MNEQQLKILNNLQAEMKKVSSRFSNCEDEISRDDLNTILNFVVAQVEKAKKA